MKMFYTWKLLRKIQRIRIRGPFICHMPLACWTWNFPPLLFGRPRDCSWCPCDRLRRRRPFFPFSGASRKAPPLIIPISPIPFSHACIRFCYCYCLLLFWCIACFCNLLIVTLPAYPKLLSIGWVVIHCDPHLVPVAPASSSKTRSTGLKTRPRHRTSLSP